MWWHFQVFHWLMHSICQWSYQPDVMNGSSLLFGFCTSIWPGQVFDFQFYTIFQMCSGSLVVRVEGSGLKGQWFKSHCRTCFVKNCKIYDICYYSQCFLDLQIQCSLFPKAWLQNMAICDLGIFTCSQNFWIEVNLFFD